MEDSSYHLLNLSFLKKKNYNGRNSVREETEAGYLVGMQRSWRLFLELTLKKEKVSYFCLVCELTMVVGQSTRGYTTAKFNLASSNFVLHIHYTT